MQTFDDISPERLLDRYNVALAQAILLRCTAMEVRIWGETPARFRQLFRAVKFHRLICTIHETAGNSYTLKLDGPLSLFSSTQKYGLQLALFLPALLHCKAFDLKASVRWGTRTQGKATSPSRPPTACARTSRTSASTRRPSCRCSPTAFAAKVKGWVIAADPHPITLADGVWVPDFKLTHPAKGKEVFVEVFGFWRKGDIETTLQEAPEGRARQVRAVRVASKCAPTRTTR